jgi:DNA mismatch repair protein MutH
LSASAKFSQKTYKIVKLENSSLRIEGSLFQEKYDKASVESILAYANLLTGKSLDEAVTLPGNVENLKNKGDLGRLVEAHFFEINPSNNQIDFPEANLELKVTGLLAKSNGTYSAKERLVLGMINFHALVEEEWETSYVYIKCQLMLILFYHFNKDIPRIDQKFVLPPLLYEIAKWDEADLKRDWQTIRAKVLAGKAHELSEGDTFLLGACRKGAGGESEALRSQPNSDVLAKSRAFSFKTSYLNRVIQRHQINASVEEPAVSLSFEDVIQGRFKPYLGMSVGDISNNLKFPKSGKNHKGFLNDLSRRMLGTDKKALPEFHENGIEMKTVRIEVDGRPREHMSFPQIDFDELRNQAWEDSDFFEKVERKFLFVVFSRDSLGELYFSKAFFWNMPFQDRLEAARVWEATKKCVEISSTEFPRAKDSRVSHVRPKARDSRDTLPLPNGMHFPKQAFWLNREYVADVVRKAT